MWKVSGQSLTMTEEDFGVSLNIKINGATLSNSDAVRVTIKDKVDGETKVSKEYSSFTDNAFDFALTLAESAALPVGNYVYSLDWYQSGIFMCNIIDHALFKVVDKA